jgi:hypothetical protein
MVQLPDLHLIFLLLLKKSCDMQLTQTFKDYSTCSQGTSTAAFASKLNFYILNCSISWVVPANCRTSVWLLALSAANSIKATLLYCSHSRNRARASFSIRLEELSQIGNKKCHTLANSASQTQGRVPTTLMPLSRRRRLMLFLQLI